jgi:dolichol-phosphate mannosyltransferase
MSTATALNLSVVVPAHNESGNLPDLIAEIVAALQARDDYEIVIVDDCSSDESPQVLASLQTQLPQLRVLRHLKNAGQSAALRNGVRHARGTWIATPRRRRAERAR